MTTFADRARTLVVRGGAGAPVVFDLAAGTAHPIADADGWTLQDVSPDGSRVALTSPMRAVGAVTRNTLRVVDARTRETCWSTERGVTHRARFDAPGRTLLVEAYNKPLAQHDAAGGQALRTFAAKHGFLTYGALHPGEDAWYQALAKGPRLLRIDLATGAATEHELPRGGRTPIAEVAVAGGDVLALRAGGALACVSAALTEARWHVDLAALLKERGLSLGGYPALRACGDGSRVCFDARDPGNEWGCLVVLGARDGAFERVIPRERGFGVIASPWGGSQVLTYNADVVDLATGARAALALPGTATATRGP